MSSINNVVLSGRLTKDIEIRKTNSGKSYCRFTLAVNRIITQNTPQDAPQADFISCLAWEKLVDVLASYTHKGSKINVVGRIQTSTYDDPNIPNRKIYATDILIQQLELCDNKPKTERPEPEEPIEQSFQITADDLPF